MNRIILTQEDVEFLKEWQQAHPDKKITARFPFEECIIEIRGDVGDISSIHAKIQHLDELPFEVDLFKCVDFTAKVWMRNEMIFEHSFSYSYATNHAIDKKIECKPQIKRTFDVSVLKQMRKSITFTFMSVMSYINNSEREIVEESTKKEVEVVRRKGKKPKRKYNSVISVGGIRKIYENRVRTGDVRKYKKPEFAVHVRGHYRHYKSGKVVWISPHEKYKDKKKKNIEKTYKIRRTDNEKI